jgi:hypothetical protein
VPSAVKVKDFCISSLFPHLLKERIKPVPSPYQKIKQKSPLLQEEFFISLFRSNARAIKQYEQNNIIANGMCWLDRAIRS